MQPRAHLCKVYRDALKGGPQVARTFCGEGQTEVKKQAGTEFLQPLLFAGPCVFA